jgi:FKBP-type peptidyl-prolyl cis-trans isomerase FkpA
MTTKPITALASSLTIALLCCVASAHAQQSADASAKEPGAVVSPSGLIYRSLKDGTGAAPKATDTVKVHYRGTLPDGNEFDSSYKRNAPAEFPLNRVIPCWTEGVSRMKVGGKAKLTCPPAIAYGASGTPGGPIPPNATLFFEVELLGINGR